MSRTNPPRRLRTLEEMAGAAADSGPGLRCPRCHGRDFRTRDTDPMPDDSVRRYRVCRNCGYIRVTRER